MDPSKLPTDIETSIVKQWGSLNNCPCLDNIRQLSHSILELKPRIKSLKKEKQNLSRAFRDPDQSQQTLAQLKLSMQTLSGELKELESSRKKAETALRKQLENKPEKASHPDRFNHQVPATIDQTIEIAMVNDDFSTQWDNYVNNHPQSSAYHLYSWKSLIQQNFCHDTVYLAALDSNQQCRGIFPLVMLNSKLFGAFAVSMPYFNYGGPLADSTEIEQSLLTFAAQQCDQRAMEHLEVRATKTLNQWPQQDNKVSMILPLPEQQAQLDSDLGAKLRAQINQAKAAKLTTKVGSTELLEDFYAVFATNMRDLGTPVYAKNFFLSILSTFSEHATVIIVYCEEKPVSAAFLMGYKDMLEIPWASTLRKYNTMNANMLLYRTVLGHAIDSGYQYFDFGRSSKDANTFRFKKQWGATPVQHQWHYWQPQEAALPGLNPSNPKFLLAIAIWKKLPVWLTKIIGPGIVKNLP